MSDYEDLFNKSWDEIPEPQVLPPGNYRLRAVKAFRKEPRSGDGNPMVNFMYTPVMPLDDVDPDELAELGDGYDITGTRLYATFWLGSELSDWDKLRRHLTKHGVDLKGLSPKDSLSAIEGAEIIGYVEIETKTNESTGELEKRNRVTAFAVAD